MQYAKLSFLALAMASLFACASAFVAPPSVARGCTHSTTELAVVRRLWRRLRGRNTGSYRDNELSEDGLTPIMEGVKSFGMAFRVEDWKRCIDTEECEVPPELFGNPNLGIATNGAKYDSLEELRTIIDRKNNGMADPGAATA
uniref:Cathepsin propeptide inhibitor domain-containing protein n=1 Tax=Phaeomonas parva TaxID=124430 RepID=A0A6U4C9Z4_9STRA|mmetsp:Transcript_10148/g.30078  ORF Transcript_10148/g.30078 Transcript_10148/m.30078 type:complete len:143 (+) Transcript_10148:166-594(+)